MKKNSGQALVEFVLILPIALLLIFSMIDLGRVLYEKNHLESMLNEVVITYKDNGKIDKNLIDSTVTSNIKANGKYTTITLTKDISLITPFSNLIIDNPYQIKTERVFIYE
jgi:Flp pilus assembly protein TadG